MCAQISTSRRLVVLPLLAILLVNVAFSGVAVAEPRIWVGSADLERDATLVGESVGVEVQLHNRGDGGVISVDVAANGSTVTTERIHVESDSSKTAVIDVTFDEPGQYKITAEDKTAGTLTVTQLRVASVTQRSDGRSALVRAGNVESGEPLTANLPEADNQSFSLQRVTMTGSGAAFNRSLATYAPTDAAPFSVPSVENSPVLGAIDMGAVTGVTTSSVRVAIDRETIRQSGLQADEVVIYRKTNGSFAALQTEQVTTTDDAIVYEASTDGGDQFIVGSLSPRFTVRSTKLGTEDAADGQRITLTTTVANDGPVTGEYVAEMRIDGVTVDKQRLTLQPAESKTVTLQHVVSKKGEYEVGLGEQSAGSVVLTSDALSSSSGDDDSGSETPGDTSTGESLLDAKPSLPSIGAIGTLELGIGAAIALVGGGLILLLRR